ncbi:hypothetical protein [Metallosphaera javensis (ex Hofmann et al. 2022)]|uniref:hypothetical protein n=1 Tax=Metallosphaera javensis (ex Hofmann et al. 2022) TaxID=99938 RepID=UPI001EDFCA96|nr:hypothetical protein [Metallosphaera javensis (ex Hofmann et al. 2022)]
MPPSVSSATFPFSLFKTRITQVKNFSRAKALTSSSGKCYYVDENGTFGEKGGIYEVDILKRDGTTYLIEVKSYAQPKDVSRFNHTCYVVSKVLNLEKPVKMMVVNVATGRALERANYLGIRLIYGELT